MLARLFTDGSNAETVDLFFSHSEGKDQLRPIEALSRRQATRLVRMGGIVRVAHPATRANSGGRFVERARFQHLQTKLDTK